MNCFYFEYGNLAPSITGFLLEHPAVSSVIGLLIDLLTYEYLYYLHSSLFFICLADAASRGKKQGKKNKKGVDEEDTANHGSSRKCVKKEDEDEIKTEDMKQLKKELKEDMKKQVKKRVKKEIKKEVKERVKKEVKEEPQQGRARKNSRKSADIKENNAVKTSITLSNKLAQKLKDNKPKRANNREKNPVKNTKTPKAKVTKKVKDIDSVHRESPVRRSKRLGSVVEN